jgi:hypothetical protein
MYGNEGYQAAESGLRQGFSLTGTPTATGNVIFFPKFQVLFANSAAFEKLSEAQRTVIREAAAATQEKAITEHPTEVDAATAWCADGGTIVMASEEQVAAFDTARSAKRGIHYGNPRSQNKDRTIPRSTGMRWEECPGKS